MRLGPMVVLGSTLLLAFAGALPRPMAAQDGGSAAPFDHIVVIYQENHSFDNYYGRFPGANGLDTPGAVIPQRDRNGQVYRALPQPVGVDEDTGERSPDARFPAELPNAPFLIDRYVPQDEIVPSPLHRFYQHQLQMNGGRMDQFVAWTNAGAMPMGYFDTAALPLYPYAREFTLADNFFTAAFGGSWLNHMWLVCACTPVFPNAPAAIVAEPEFDVTGRLVGLRRDGDVTPDGYAVNDLQPVYTPHKPDTPPDRLVPPQTAPNIGDRLSAAGISWAWYAGDWDEILAGNTEIGFSYHHQPFVYFASTGDGTPAKAQHLRDERDFLAALSAGTLPAVSFVKPGQKFDEHAGRSTVADGERHAAGLIEAVRRSPYWQKTVIILTYDDYGGWYDHVPPPVVDRWGPGGRVPALIISPYAKRGFVDHTLYDTTSILKFIEWRFGLQPLAERDARASNLLNALNLEAAGGEPAGAASAGAVRAARERLLGPLAR